MVSENLASYATALQSTTSMMREISPERKWVLMGMAVAPIFCVARKTRTTSAQLPNI